MIAQDLQTLLNARPFVPFRICATGGLVRDIRHPDQATAGRTYILLPIPGTGDTTEERSEMLALAHIVRIETAIPRT